MLSALLKTLLEVIRQNSVTAAARRLKLSQPTVTAQIRQLEASYGIELFQRRGGRMMATDAAIELLPHIERLLQLEAELDFRLRDASQRQHATLRLAATGPYYLLEHVAAFRQRAPQVTVALEFGNSQQVIDALDEGRADLVVSSQQLERPALARWTLAQSPLVLVVHRGHALAALECVPLDALAPLTLLLREPGSVTRQTVEALLRQAGVTPQAMLEFGSREAIREAIVHGLGCTLMAAGEVMPHPQLRTVALAHCDAHIHEYLYCLESRRAFGPLKAFVEMTQAGSTRPV
ncbi:LysR substrate-binding domain-containing protein [Chitinibacteraceae bacterium HSL-7]